MSLAAFFTAIKDLKFDSSFLRVFKAGFMKTVPLVYTLLMKTIYLSIPQSNGELGNSFLVTRGSLPFSWVPVLVWTRRVSCPRRRAWSRTGRPRRPASSEAPSSQPRGTQSHLDTGYFRKVYRSLQVRVPHNILKYLSIQKLPQKRSHQSIYLANSQKKRS